jgi:hypothetical protein
LPAIQSVNECSRRFRNGHLLVRNRFHLPASPADPKRIDPMLNDSPQRFRSLGPKARPIVGLLLVEVEGYMESTNTRL